MKLVQLLAKELKEWPEDCDEIWQSAMDREIYFEGGDHGYFELSNAASDRSYEGAHVTREQWQAEREKMNKPKWIRHRRGNRRVDDDVFVEVKLRCGDVQRGEAKDFIWSHHCCDSAANIMAYRVIEETKDQEIEEVRKFSKDVDMNIGKGEIIHGPVSIGDTVITAAHPKLDTNLGTLTYKLEIDATEATQQIDSLVAKWDQLESPLKWRDEIIELEAYEEEFRREREKLIRKLESEGFKLIDHMAPVYGEQIIDFSDWRNWQPGDIVECLIAPDKHEGYYFSGINYKINEVDLDDEGRGCEISVYCERAMSLWCPSSSFKFIRRP